MLKSESKSTSKVPNKIEGYHVLPIQLPRTELIDSATHFLYLRRHEPKIPTPEDGRCLFAVNLPVDATEAHLRALFSGIGGGRVEEVEFADRPKKVRTPPPALGKKRKRGEVEEKQNKEEGDEIKIWNRPLHKSGTNAVVMFVDKASCEMSLKAAGTRAGGKDRVVWGDGILKSTTIPPLGLSRYKSHQTLRFPSRVALQSSVDSYISSYEEEETEKRRQLARRRQEPDEDGFVTVTRPVRQADAKAAAERAKAKEKEGELQGFYRFQVREQRKERQMELLKKFEEDKKRVKERKEQRKFRPL